MQRFLPGALLALLAAGGRRACAQTRELTTSGELLDRVAAVVNDGVVLNSELDEQVAPSPSACASRSSSCRRENVLRQQVLERLVLQEIQMQRADTRGHQGAGRER